MKILKLVILVLLTSLFFLLIGCENSTCNRCELEPDPGLCKAHFPKYYFDKEEQKCKEFIWGGCNGSVPFDTMEECQTCDCNN